MAYVNNITVCGRMTSDLQTQANEHGESCYFTLAVNRNKDAADFIPVRTNSKFISEKIRALLVKGAAVLVTGRIESGSYKNKDGATRSYFYIAPDSIQPGITGNFNHAILFGNLTADPEMRYTDSGKAVVSFDVGCNRRYKDKDGEWKDAAPTFIHANAWEARSEFICKYFKKGSGILLSGSVRSRRFDDKQGNARTAYDFVVTSASFADSSKREANGQNTAPAAAAPDNYAAQNAQPQAGMQYNVPDQYSDFSIIEDDEDLPF